MEVKRIKSYIRLRLAETNGTFIKSKEAARINVFAEGKVSAYKDILNLIERLEREEENANKESTLSV